MALRTFETVEYVPLRTLDYLDESVNDSDNNLLLVHSDVSLALRMDRLNLSTQVVEDIKSQLVSCGVSDIPYPSDLDSCSSNELHLINEPNFVKNSMIHHSNYVKNLLSYYDNLKDKAKSDDDVKLYKRAVDIIKMSAKNIVDEHSN